MPQQQALILSVNSVAARRGADQATAALDGVRKSAAKAATGIDRLEKAASNLTRAGRALAIGLTTPILGVAAAATKLATDAGETANKFDVVMGPAADRLRQRFEELHAIIPATRAEMEGLTAGVQDLLVPLGIARNEAADMSLAFLELGADIGSFNNVATTQVLDAFKSALAGMSRPLRQFGIDVSNARLEAIALERGLLDADGAMTTAARAQAVLIAATRDSADAMGDSARTAKDTANQFRFLVRNLKELATTIGNQLLPVVTPLVQRMNEMLQTAGGLNSSTVQWGISVGVVTAALGPLLLVVGSLTKALAGLGMALKLGAVATGGLGIAITGVIAIVGALAARFVKSRIEAAAFRAEMERVNEAMMGDPEQVGASLATARAQLEASQQRLAALRSDMRTGATGVDPARLQDQFNAELANMIRLANKVRELEQTLARLQGMGGVGGALAGTGSGGGDFRSIFAGLPEPVIKLADSFERTTVAAGELKGKVSVLAREGGEGLQGLALAGQSIAFAFSDTLAGALMGSRNAFKQFVDFAISQLVRLAAQMAVLKGLELLFQGSTGGIGKVLGGLFQSTFGGERAHGGMVRQGETYLVGERGPELFTANQSGRIVPNHAMGGAATVQVNVPPAQDPRTMVRDQQWMGALVEMFDELRERGYDFGVT